MSTSPLPVPHPPAGLPATAVAWTPQRAEADTAEPSLRNTMIAGFATIAVAFGGFVGWSAVASLNSAALAHGTVIVDSHRKTVQHFEGGIVQAILVKEGQRVTAGQPVIRLDDTQARASAGQIQNQYWTALARTARLKTELEGERKFEVPEELSKLTQDTGMRTILRTEVTLFDARWQSHDSTIAVSRKRINQLRKQIEALEAQAKSTKQRLGYIRDELASVKALLAKGYERKPRLLELQRDAADAEGLIGQLTGEKAEAEQAIAAAELEIIDLENKRRSDILAELQKTQTEAADLSDRLRATQDVLTRTEVLSPQDGLITDLRFHTPGGVIAPGAPIMDIVPDNDEMIVEAKVSPTDIDTVRVGMATQVRLTAYKQKTVPAIDGKIVYLAADQVIDERTGNAYYVSRIQLDPASIEQAATVELYPGMPAEVIIVTGKRRALEYFLGPITDTIRRAFLED